MNAANSLTDVVTQITSGLLGDLTGVDIDLTEVTNQLNLLNNLQSLGGANFTSDQTLSADGSYISADVSDGLGLVVAQNVSTILRDLQSAISSLEASGSGIASNVVATAINAALTPVKGTLNTAINVALPLLNAGGSLVNQLLDASVLGSTTVTLPTTVSAPQNLTQNLDARFVGSVIQANAVDVNLISTGNGSSTIYFAPADSSAVTAPNITNVTGTSTNGYTVTGTADPNVTVEIRNQSGTTIATATTDDTGAFTANIPAGQVTAGENLNAVAIDNGTESTATNFQTPNDPTNVTAPTINNVTGTSTDGYTITGTADPNVTVEIRNQSGTTIATATTDDTGAFTANIPAGQATAEESLTAVAISNGTESTGTNFETPGDPTATVATPTVDNVTGNSTAGYTVTGTAKNGTTIEVRNADGTVIGTGTTDPNGNYTVTIDPGKATPEETVNVVAINANDVESQPATATTPADIPQPTVTGVTGSTTAGYEVTGTAEPNQTVEVRDTDGNVIGTATADTDGNFTVTIDPGKASANETINVVATDGNGNESQPTTATTPADVTAPTVDGITGNTNDGYEVTGSADPNTTIEIRDQDGNVIADGTTDANGNFTVTIDPGAAGANETVEVVATDENGNESQPTTATTPADVTSPTEVTPPTVDGITGNTNDGYEVTGSADPNTTIEIRDPDGNVIADGSTDANGDYTVTIDPGVVNPGDTINVVGIDNNGNESQPTQVVVPADGEDIIIVAPTIDSVIGTSTTGYEVKGKAEPNRNVQISNTRVQTEEAAELVQPVMLRSLLATAAPVSPLAATPVIATTTADAQGNFTVQLAVGAAQAQESLLATATDGQGNYSLATLFSTPADPTSPTNPDDNGTGSGGTSTGTGTTPGAGTGTGTTSGVGSGMGNGTGTGVSGMGTTGAGLNNGGYGSGFGTNGTGFGGMYYGSGSGYTGSGTSYPSTGEKENVTAGIFGGLLALLASLGIIKRNRSKE